MRLLSLILAIALVLAMKPWSAESTVVLSNDKIKTVTHSVVHVICPSRNVSGSGFIYRKSTWIVTALHVVSGCDNIRVSSDAMPETRAEIRKVRSNADLALLEVIHSTASPRPLPVFVFNGEMPQEDLVLVGYDRDLPTAGTQLLTSKCCRTRLSQLLLQGELSSLRVPSPDTPIIELNGALVHGHSGAPIFDTEGRIVGIGDGGLAPLGNTETSWAIPATEFESLMRSREPRPIGALERTFNAEYASDARGYTSPVSDAPTADINGTFIEYLKFRGQINHVVLPGIYENHHLFIAIAKDGHLLPEVQSLFSDRAVLTYEPAQQRITLTAPARGIHGAYITQMIVGRHEGIFANETRDVRSPPFTYGKFVFVNLRVLIDSVLGSGPLWDPEGRRWVVL